MHANLIWLLNIPLISDLSPFYFAKPCKLWAFNFNYVKYEPDYLKK